jgi:hypothetical protein
MPMLDVVLNLDEVSKNMGNLWLADLGASCHMTFSEEGTYDCKDVRVPIKIGNGKSMVSTKIGKKKVTMVLADGRIAEIILDNCKLVPNLWVNSFSLTQSLQKGWNLNNEGLKFVLTKHDFKILFDRIIKTSHGHVSGIELTVVDINDFNQLMGHVHEDSLRKMAVYYGFKLQGQFNACFECSLAKIRQ